MFPHADTENILNQGNDAEGAELWAPNSQTPFPNFFSPRAPRCQMRVTELCSPAAATQGGSGAKVSLGLSLLAGRSHSPT